MENGNMKYQISIISLSTLQDSVRTLRERRHRCRGDGCIQAGYRRGHVNRHGCSSAIGSDGVGEVFGGADVTVAGGAVVAGGADSYIQTTIAGVGRQSNAAGCWTEFVQIEYGKVESAPDAGGTADVDDMVSA